MSFVNGLRRVGFESIVDYEEAHGRLVDIWAFVLAMKDGESRANWFMSEAEINLKIKKRAMKTKNAVFPFYYFDGATMMLYQFSSRVVEETWCRDKTEECRTGHGFDPEIPNIPRSALEVKPSAIATGGRGVFAAEFIAKGSYILLEECVHGMLIPGTTYHLMDEAATTSTNNMSDFWDVVFLGYVDGYGWVNNGYVSFGHCRIACAGHCSNLLDLRALEIEGVADWWSRPGNLDFYKPRLQRAVQCR